MNSLAHINGNKVVDMVGGMKFKKMAGQGGEIIDTIKSILMKIFLVIGCIIIYKFYLNEFVDVFLKVQCSRYSWPIGMINEIKPFPFCVSFAKKMSTKLNIYEKGRGTGSEGSLTIDPHPHEISAAGGKISAKTEVGVRVKELTKIMNKHIQETQQVGIASQKIIGVDKVRFPKNEKKAQHKVYVRDDVNEKVYMGEMPPPEQLCTIGKPKCNPKNKKQCICEGESYNVILPTGVMKYVLPGQISPVYGCSPNIEQNIKMTSYQLNTSKKELIKELSNQIKVDADTSVEVQGEPCNNEIRSEVDAKTYNEINTTVENQINQLINQDVSVSQKLTVEDRYGMCSPPYPFHCNKLESDNVYPQKDGKCNCNELLNPDINGKWTTSVFTKCKDPSDCKCYNCCQSNQRWIRQSITIDTVAKNIAKSSAEIIMKNKLKTKVNNSVKYIQNVPARIIMLSFLWNVAALYVLYYILRFVRRNFF